MVVIEMNPRVSRSSALASKATGFPIAKVAAKLAVGYTLDEIDNEITGGATPASFEPTIDYVVTKIPRFAFEKYPGAKAQLTTSMKSVGEAMAIGRTFQESVQKALRSLETGLSGFDEIEVPGWTSPKIRPARRQAVMAALSQPTPDRLRVIAQAFREGLSVEDIQRPTPMSPGSCARSKRSWSRRTGPPDGPAGRRRRPAPLKAMGFSDARLAKLTGNDEAGVKALRKRWACARSSSASTPAPPSSPAPRPTCIPATSRGECESEPTGRKKAIILGGGPNRIGQGIEFDYCCCHAAFAFEEMGIESIMVNCNPETVSTDYDTADRLVFRAADG
jgi:carbamoyl-phosphate synthase large subunit